MDAPRACVRACATVNIPVALKVKPQMVIDAQRLKREREQQELVADLQQSIATYLRIIDRARQHTQKLAKELMVDVPTTRREARSGNGSAVSGERGAHRNRSQQMPAPSNGASTPRRNTGADQVRSAVSSEAGTLAGIRKGARRILAELAKRHPLSWTKSQVAQLTGFTASGGTFTAYIGDLKRNGLIHVNGKDVTVTEVGLDAVGEVEAAPATHEEVMAMWRDKMRAGEFRLLERIAEAGEGGIDREELAADTEYAITGGTFTAYIGTLNRNQLIEKRGALLVPSRLEVIEYQDYLQQIFNLYVEVQQPAQRERQYTSVTV